jgi:hypothetical protein
MHELIPKCLCIPAEGVSSKLLVRGRVLRRIVPIRHANGRQHIRLGAIDPNEDMMRAGLLTSNSLCSYFPNTSIPNQGTGGGEVVHRLEPSTKEELTPHATPFRTFPVFRVSRGIHKYVPLLGRHGERLAQLTDLPDPVILCLMLVLDEFTNVRLGILGPQETKAGAAWTSV